MSVVSGLTIPMSFNDIIRWACNIVSAFGSGRLPKLMSYTAFLTIGCLALSSASSAQTLAGTVATEQTPAYVLGPDDQIIIRARDVEEIDGRSARVDLQGYIDVPLVGKFKAAGLTVEQLEAGLANKLAAYVVEPRVAVTVSEYRSQPVSVLGAVNAPGVYNLTGHNTLVQVLSKAGGLRNDAGNTVDITRRSERGGIPLPSAKRDPSGEFSTAEVNLRSLLEAEIPQDNIVIEPTDIISVPRADLVYIVGAVRRPGGFVLNERANMTVLEALSMAEGLDKIAAPKRAKIIRKGTATDRVEIPVNLAQVLSGKSPDVPLLANDILFVPNSGAKAVGYRAIEAAIQVGTGVVIYRP